jgi:hypothetical protein
MQLKTWHKRVLSAIVVLAGGFVLFNLAFMLAAAVGQLYSLVVRLFGGQHTTAIESGIWQYIYLVIVLLISWFILRSKWPDLVKATYLTMPLMVVLIMIGILLYEQPQWLPIAIGAVIVGAVILYLYAKKQSWLYYLATAYTGLLALFIVLAGIDI